MSQLEFVEALRLLEVPLPWRVEFPGRAYAANGRPVLQPLFRFDRGLVRARIGGGEEPVETSPEASMLLTELLVETINARGGYCLARNDAADALVYAMSAPARAQP